MCRRWRRDVDRLLEPGYECVKHGSRCRVAKERRVKEVAAFHDDVGILLLDERIESVGRAEVLFENVNKRGEYMPKRSEISTGIPHEHEMPAPVRTTIFLHFATASERLDSDRRVEGSPADLSRSRVTVMAFSARGRV